jgi:chemotaxis protein MotB
MADAVQPIIVKRIKKGGHGHHGGAWKVAYADFVTAMMAFFLLLWLLNATTEEQKRGIADYFTPASVSQSQSGSGGVLGGTVISLDGVLTANGGPTDGASTPEAPDNPAEEAGADPDAEPVAADPTEMTEQQLAEEMAKREQEQFEKAAETLKQAIESIPELAQLKDSLLIDQTPEGLRIQLADQEGTSMFPLGSSAPNENMQRLIGLVAAVVQKLPNQISVSGHTDDLPYRTANGYTNWELSADRANAARRLLIGTGFPSERVSLVQGRAATEPLLPEDTGSPRNRRISIVLLREADKAPPPSSIFNTGSTPAKGAAITPVEPAYAPASAGHDASSG